MPILKIENMAEHGIITDMLPHQLPPNAWTSGRNVRFLNNKVMKFTGYSVFYDPGDGWDGSSQLIIDSTGDKILVDGSGDSLVIDTLSSGANTKIYFLLPVSEGSDYYWIYCGLESVYVYDTSTSSSSDITRSTGFYTATAANVSWTGGIIGGIPVLNNGVDVPQMWATVDPDTRLTPLTGFSSSADSCGALRVFKNYLIALDVTKSSVRYPLLVKWSDSAALGSVPASWDETDATTDAGENNLSEGRWDRAQGVCLDCLPLRDVNIIYRDDSVWSMSFIGGTQVFAFRQIYANQGMLARRCMSEFEGKHFVVGQSDIYVHDGTTFTSVIDSRRRTSFYSDLDPDNYRYTFVFANYPKTEMWVCYKNRSDGVLPNKAMVWNWRSNTWGERDLPLETGHIVGGIVNTFTASDDWQTLDNTWDDGIDRPWGDLGYSPQSASPAIGSDRIYKGDETNQEAGVNMVSNVERTGIPLGEQDEFMRIKAVYPRMYGTKPVNISVGAQMAPGATPNYQKSVAFDPNTGQRVNVRVTGTHAAIKIESSDDQEWELSGLDIEYERVSRR